MIIIFSEEVLSIDIFTEKLLWNLPVADSFRHYLLE